MSSVGGARRTTRAPAAPAVHEGGGARAVGRLPDFFIVGQPKTGTTALYEMLGSHPGVYLPASKEPWYFAEELLERTPPRPEGTPRTLEEYTELFAQALPGQRVGEASALYLWSPTAARRIAEVRPDARIVAILREPASLLRSLHLQWVEIFVETENDFRTALALEDARRDGRQIPRHTYWPQALFYSEHVRYVEQLTRYRELFGSEQMLVLLYDDFRADNEATVRAVLEFLGLPPDAGVKGRRANPTVHVRSQRLNELLHAVSVGHGPASLAAKRAIKALTPRALRRGALQAAKTHLVYGAPPPVDEGFMRELRERYRPEVRALAEYLGRDLETLWRYRDV